MQLAVDHDGITWKYGRRLDVAAVAILACAASVALTAVVAQRWGAAVASAGSVVPMVALLVALQALRRTTVRLTHRMVSIRGRSLFGAERHDVRVDDIREAGCAESDRGDLALLLKTHHETVVIGAHQPEDQVRWMGAAVAHARGQNAVREAREGREWGFLRQAPEALDRLGSRVTTR